MDAVICSDMLKSVALIATTNRLLLANRLRLANMNYKHSNEKKSLTHEWDLNTARDVLSKGIMSVYCIVSIAHCAIKVAGLAKDVVSPLRKRLVGAHRENPNTSNMNQEVCITVPREEGVYLIQCFPKGIPSEVKILANGVIPLGGQEERPM
eukprot:4554717-Pyramimonas_sp.AAC.2